MKNSKKSALLKFLGGQDMHDRVSGKHSAGSRWTKNVHDHV